jgi:hypothetical protein
MTAHARPFLLSRTSTPGRRRTGWALVGYTYQQDIKQGGSISMTLERTDRQRHLEPSYKSWGVIIGSLVGLLSGGLPALLWGSVLGLLIGAVVDKLSDGGNDRSSAYRPGT